MKACALGCTTDKDAKSPGGDSVRLAAAIGSIQELTEELRRDLDKSQTWPQRGEWFACPQLFEAAKRQHASLAPAMVSGPKLDEVRVVQSATFGTFRIARTTQVSKAAITEDEISLELAQRKISVQVGRLVDAGNAKALPEVLRLLSAIGLAWTFVDQADGAVEACLTCLAPAAAAATDSKAAAHPAKPKAAFDSLIIDASGRGLRPASNNRIVTPKGKALFDCNKVTPSALAKNGCADYAADVRKATAALAARGLKKPLLLKAAGVQRATDAQVAESDVEAIAAAGNSAGFFENGLVVFVP